MRVLQRRDNLFHHFRRACRRRFQKLFKADVRFFVRRIGHRADHDERRVQLVAGLRNRCCFHFHRFDFGEMAADFRHAFAAMDKAVAISETPAPAASCFEKPDSKIQTHLLPSLPEGLRGCPL